MFTGHILGDLRKETFSDSNWEVTECTNNPRARVARIAQ